MDCVCNICIDYIQRLIAYDKDSYNGFGFAARQCHTKDCIIYEIGQNAIKTMFIKDYIKAIYGKIDSECIDFIFNDEEIQEDSVDSWAIFCTKEYALNELLIMNKKIENLNLLG